jgi:hypothetical protein
MKTIEEMAREAGLWPAVTDNFPKELAALAELVRADEREACLNWCAACATDDGTAQKIDAAIRAMGNT